ncbi:uncharacterized protein LOC115381919 [Salarias fasciatus]|uniref:uncharacterized protein LOC115381919 n=1 Tax=Salarias fasciatus TaxID=181472 RepID=UPI0011770483|nr:uncharacterized protein LOC115381919 [Salarias fasciatus]XP_029939423.1 uncharacterized protein LOC115381919 [Salarias fasciatus]
MVHSDSASPMKTTPSASPHLTVTATAPPLMLSHGGTAVQDLNHIPTQALTTDLTSNSGFTQPSTLTPADANPTAVTPAKTLSISSISTTTPAPDPISGRTSGRKRTPKACNCCGPNSTGHNVKTSVGGRGSGRGRGAGRNIGHTLKRNFQVTPVKNLDLAKEKSTDENDTGGKVQQSGSAVDNAPSQTTETPVSLQDVPVKSCVESEKQQVKKKKTSPLGSEVSGALQMEGSDSPNTEKSALGTAEQGGFIVISQNREGREIEIKGAQGGATTLKTDALGQSMPGENQNTPNSQHKHGGETNTVNSSFRNGETVNLCDTEEEVQEDYMIVIEPGNGPLSTSWPVTPGVLQDLDAEAEVFHSPERMDLFSLASTLSNGNISPSENHNHSAMLETPHPSKDSSPTFTPISVNQKDHPWAIWDHKLYTLSGTWENNEEGTSDRTSQQEAVMDATMQREEVLAHLTHMVHEFLEQFYIKYGSFIPLTETDVLEHLKTEGSPDLVDSGLDIKGEITRYRAGLASAPFTGFMVTYNKHTLSLEDLGTLEEQNWLNDQIINMYGELIMEATEHKVHFFNSFFHKQLVAKGYDGVKRWTKKVDLFSKWLLLIPIHLEIHWSLVTVTMATKTISYYDSQGIVFRHTTDNIMKYLQSEASEKKLTGFQKGWTTAIIKGIPQQKNDSDCGVFILEYCRRLSVKKPLLFSQEDMPCIRKRIYKELCDCHLNN